MIARFGLLKRPAGMTPQAFDLHWRDVHGPKATHFPGLRAYYQHLVVDNEQFGISHARGGWDLDGFSELHFDDIASMRAGSVSPDFAEAAEDEKVFLGDLHLVACEKHVVVPVETGDGPFVKRMTILKRLPGMSQQDFRREWLEVHADWVRQWPNVLGYVQNIAVDRYHGAKDKTAPYEDVPVDGIVEFWFRDKEMAAELYASDIVTRTQEHAKAFLDTITPFFVETRRIV